VARQVEHLEPGHCVALRQRAGDRERAAVHVAEGARGQGPHDRIAHLAEVDPVAHPAVALRSRALLGVTEDGGVELRSATAVVGMRVAQHDPLDAPACRAGVPDRLRHPHASRLEQRDAVVVLEQVDVGELL
jgi:hypothetical protein